MSDWSKDIDLEVIKEYLQECAENDDYHYEQYQVDIVMHEYIRQKLVIEKLDKEIERLNNIIKRLEEDLREMYLTFGEFSEEYTEKKIKELKGEDKE